SRITLNLAFTCVPSVAMSCSPAARSMHTRLHGRRSPRPFTPTAWPSVRSTIDLKP
ncbi:MSRB1 isoform 5, partial [Pan troglodytes]